MTETTVGMEIRLNVRWGSFFLSLFAAPFFSGLLGFIAASLIGFSAIIPVFALVFGWPTYLIFGAPAFYFTIRYWGAGAWKMSLAGLAANLVSFPFVYLIFDLEFAQFLVGNGCLMAPVWGAVFGELYFRGNDHAY